MYLRTRVAIGAKRFRSDSTSRPFNSKHALQLIHAGVTYSRSYSFFSFLRAIVGREEVEDRLAVKPDQGFLLDSTSMAMDCCHKEYVEDCEILVCEHLPAPFNPTLYSRLRFGLLASSWLPSRLGIFLWRALHVMLLIVGGPAFWVLELLTAFLIYSVIIFGQSAIFEVIFYVMFGLILVAVDLILLLVQLIRFCWSLVGFLACHEPIVEGSRGGACLTVKFWQASKAAMRNLFWAFVPIGVPCMSGSLYQESKDRKLETWARWSEEVVHMHEAIAL